MAQADIDLDLLRCFVVVAETKSFTLTGHRLGRSQSAVSIRINKLETHLGRLLFARDSRNVTLTDHGLTLLPKAIKLLELGAETVASLKSPLLSGKLRIGCLEYLAPHRLPEILTRLKRRLPDAELQFQVGLSKSLMSKFDKGEVDVVLAMQYPERGDGIPLANDQLVWATGASNANRPVEGEVNLSLLEAPCFYRHSALAALEKAAIPYREVLTASNIFAIRSAVASGLGITVLGASSLGEEIIAINQNLPVLPAMTLSIYGIDDRKHLFAQVARQVLGDYVDLL